MAVRTPVFFNGADIQEMSTAQIDAIKRQAKFKYSESPSVTLTYASGSGSLGTINDTRQQSGSTLTNASAFQDASLGSQITVANAHIDENKDTNMYSVVDSNNIKFPCFLDGSNNVQPMSDSDFIDIFIKPALRHMIQLIPTRTVLVEYFIYKQVHHLVEVQLLIQILYSLTQEMMEIPLVLTKLLTSLKQFKIIICIKRMVLIMIIRFLYMCLILAVMYLHLIVLLLVRCYKI